jgi:hypothetical protein
MFVFNPKERKVDAIQQCAGTKTRKIMMTKP